MASTAANNLTRIFPDDVVTGTDLNPIIEAIDGGRQGVVTVLDGSGTTTITAGALGTGVVGTGTLGSTVPGTPNTPTGSAVIDNVAQANNMYINLAWVDPTAAADHVVSYEVKYRKSADTVYYYRAFGTTTAKIDNLFPGQAYQLAVRAQNNLGIWSAYSAEATIPGVLDAVAPSIPTGLTSYKTPRGAYVTWNANPITETDLQGYLLQVTLNGGTSWTAVNPGPTLATALPYTLNGVTVGQALQFRIAAIDWSQNTSLYSSASTAVTVDGVKFDELVAGNLTVLGTITGLGGIQTGSAGQRVVVDVNGVRMYNSGNTLQVDINANGTASLSGTIIAGGLTSGTITGSLFQTSATVGVTGGSTGNGVMIDSTNGLRIFNGAGTVTMSAAINGTVAINSAAGLTIVVGTANNVFKVDSNGIYLGNATFASAPFSVSMTGALVATSATITGTITGSNIYGSTIATASNTGTNGIPSSTGYSIGGAVISLYGDSGTLIRFNTYNTGAAVWTPDGTIYGGKDTFSAVDYYDLTVNSNGYLFLNAVNSVRGLATSQTFGWLSGNIVGVQPELTGSPSSLTPVDLLLIADGGRGAGAGRAYVRTQNPIVVQSAIATLAKPASSIAGWFGGSLAVELPSTPSVTLTPSGVGGSMAAGAYSYVVSSIDAAGGESAYMQSYSTTTTGSTGSVVMSWTAVPGAASYKVYRTTGAFVSPSYIANPTTNSYTDTALNATAGAPLTNGYQTALVASLNTSGTSYVSGGDLQLGARLVLSTAVSKIIPGATSLSLRNHLDNTDNLIVTDAGAVTIANGLTVSAGGIKSVQGTSDNTGYTTFEGDAGAGSAKQTIRQYTQTSIGAVTPKQIMDVSDITSVGFMIVNGYSGTDQFVDILLVSNPIAPVLISGITISGSPGARTYSLPGPGVIRLVVAGGHTYTTNSMATLLTAR